MNEVADRDHAIIGWGDHRRLRDGICGHCSRAVAFTEPHAGACLSFRQELRTEDDEDTEFRTHFFIMGLCPHPHCHEATIVYRVEQIFGRDSYALLRQETIFPRSSPRPPLPAEVPADLAAIYREAASIEDRSPTGAAFLAGRILEQTLRHTLKKAKGPLVGLIDRFLEQPHVPEGLTKLMHDVRELRNIAGHPAQGEDGAWIIVDQVEAAYVLDVVAELLDFVYVRPHRQSKMRARIQAKKEGKALPVPAGAPVVERADPPKPAPAATPFDADNDSLPF